MAGLPERTSVILYRGVPFDDENVLYFGVGAIQESYITWLNKYQVHRNLGDLSYQRDSMFVRYRLETPSLWNDLMDVNYMVYMNVGHETRWTFCRVTHVEYINTLTAHIHFTVDYWHTYVDTLKITGGFIEREHYLNEQDFDTEAMRIETLDVGEPVVYDTIDVEPESGIGYLVTYVKTPDGQIMESNMYRETSESQLPVIYPQSGSLGGITDLDGLNEIIGWYKDHPDAISDIWAVPWYRINNRVINVPYPPPKPGQIQNPWSKCWKFPNMYIRVTNGQGTEKRYYAEYFIVNTLTGETAQPSFQLTFQFDCGYPVIRLTPRNYKGIPLNIAESIYIDSFPRLRWTGDSFGNWLATNGTSTLISAGGLILGAGLAPFTAGTSLGMAVAGVAVGGLGNLGGNVYNKYKQDDRVLGSASMGGASAYMQGDFPGFRIQVMGAFPGVISANNSYWNAYGYFKGHAGKPNLDKNPYWNYVKGNINFEYFGRDEANKTIKGMFANGVRLWHNNGVFGDLSQDNRG